MKLNISQKLNKFIWSKEVINGYPQLNGRILVISAIILFIAITTGIILGIK